MSFGALHSAPRMRQRSAPSGPSKAMSLLFPIAVEPADVPSIPGLSYRRQYISAGLEKTLAQAIEQEPWDTTWDRRRQLYGWSYGDKSAAVRPIPTWALPLVERMQAERISDRPFNQMLVNEYLPGQGIAAHHDYRPF